MRIIISLATKKIKVLNFILILLLISIYACETTTNMNATWKNPAFQGKKFSKIMVLGIHKDLPIRSKIEKDIVRELKVHKINGLSGSDVIDLTRLEKGDDGKLSEKSQEYLKEIIEQNNVDAGLIIALKDIKESEHYVPGSTYYSPYYGPYMGYGSFYGYYWNSYNMYSTPGYMQKTTQVFLVSNLYDAATKELLWSAQSETTDPTSISDFSRSYSMTLVNTLIDKKIIK